VSAAWEEAKAGRARNSATFEVNALLSEDRFGLSIRVSLRDLGRLSVRNRMTWPVNERRQAFEILRPAGKLLRLPALYIGCRDGRNAPGRSRIAGYDIGMRMVHRRGPHTREPA